MTVGCEEAELTLGAAVAVGFWDTGKELAVGDGESGLSGLGGAPGGVSGLSGLSGLGAPVDVGSCLGATMIGDGRRS